MWLIFYATGGSPFAEQTKKRSLTCQADEVRMAGRLFR